MFKKILRRFGRMNFDWKMKLFIFLSIGLTTLIILFASTFSYISLISKTSLSLLENQLQTMADSLSTALRGYKNIAIAITLDESVQRYLKKEADNSSAYYDIQMKARQSMVNILNIHSDMNFIAIIKEDLSETIYSGTTTLTASQLYERYDEDMAGSKSVGIGAMRVNFQSAYYNNDQYVVSVYHPLYDTNHIGLESGLLCFNIREPVLRQFLDSRNEALEYQIFLIDGSGVTVSCSNIDQVGVKEEFTSFLSIEPNGFELDGKIYRMVKLDYWDYYVVAAIDRAELYRDGIQTILLLIAVIVLMMAVGLLVGTRIVKHSYQTMNEIVYCMECVSDGQLEVTMNENPSGDDFSKIAQGFNHMTRQLGNLMEQVKEEQHQIEQIKINALQSQIKPHFLYNTLECIHWQAVMDGNKVVSRTVKALGDYYRLCLSNGQDIIGLSQEIQHVKSYLTIQNVRYGDIITFEVSVDPSFETVQIPKMTLQPLVENSIYHGIKIKDGQSGRIWISARREKSCIVVTLEDDGVGMEQSRIDEMNASISIYDEDFGYGVRNVHKRIELLFGKEYGLFYRSNQYGGLAVDIRLPDKA